MTNSSNFFHFFNYDDATTRPKGSVKYAKGFKYCKSCGRWSENAKDIKKCPDCNRLARLRPAKALAKEKLYLVTKGRKMSRY